MSTKKLLFTEEVKRKEMMSQAKDLIEILIKLKGDYTYLMDKKMEASDVIELVRMNSIQEKENINKILFAKYNEDIEEFSSNYPKVQKMKALDMFVDEADRQLASELIHLASIVKALKSKLDSHRAKIEFEHLLKDGEFEMNGTLKTRITNSCNIMCENDTQVRLKELCERIQKEVEVGIKSGLLSGKTIGVNLSNLMNVDSGKIDYKKILKY